MRPTTALRTVFLCGLTTLLACGAATAPDRSDARAHLQRFDQLIADACAGGPSGGGGHGSLYGSFGSSYASFCATGTDPLVRRVRGAIEGGRLGIDPEALA